MHRWLKSLTESGGEPFRKRGWPWLLLPLLLAGLLYARMVTAGYVWDDTLIQRWQIQHFQTVHDAFFPSQNVFELTRAYYRPLVLLSYMFDRSLAGAGTRAAASLAHTLNILYHMIATGLVFALAHRLFRNHPRRVFAASLAATVFAVHPIHAESVCNIAGRTDMFALIFILGALLAAVKCRDAGEGGWPWTVVAAGLYALGLLSKETALSALALLPLASLWVPRGEGDAAEKFKVSQPQFLLGVLLAVATLAYFLLRYMSFSHYGGAPEEPAPMLVWRVFSALGYYVQKSLVPWPQLHYVPKVPGGALTVPVLALSLAAFAWAYRSRRGDAAGRGFLLLCLSWFFLSLAPSLTVAVRSVAVTPVAERYLYMPTVSVGLLAGYWLLRADFAKVQNRAFAGLCAVLLAGYAGTVVERTGVWRTDLAFWKDAANTAEGAETPIVLSNLGEAYQTVGDDANARVYYRKAYDLFQDPIDRLKIMANLGAMAVKDGQRAIMAGNMPEALAKADQAIEYLEPVLRSPLMGDGIPNASMANALVLKFKAKATGFGSIDIALLQRALSHLNVAARTIRDNPQLVQMARECELLISRYPGQLPR